MPVTLDENAARLVLEASHGAWSRGDVEGMLRWMTDDILYSCNTGGPDGGPLIVEGKDGMRAFLGPVAVVAESMSVVDLFEYRDMTARARIDCYIRHRSTGHLLTGSYRQVVEFRGNLISRLEEFHDAAKMIAFWKLVIGEELNRSTGDEAKEGEGADLN